MKSRTTLVALCCVSLVILSATAFKINDAAETKVKDEGSEVILEELENETKKTAEEIPTDPKLAEQAQEVELEVDTAENVDDAISSLTIQDTDGRSKFVNNQYIPDDFSNIYPKPLFELLQEETNQQNPPKPLAKHTYDNFGASANVVCEKELELKRGNTYKLPKPTKPPSLFLRPRIAQPSRPNASNKGPTKFKTVSTTSQFVATPAANLLLKLEIGIAPPSQQIDDENLFEIGNQF